MTKVEQVDREAAAKLCRILGGHNAPPAKYYEAGVYDQSNEVVAFARHRRAAHARGREEGLREALAICERQRETFLSPEYATGQPFSSFGERFACTRIAEQIEALIPKSAEVDHD